MRRRTPGRATRQILSGSQLEPSRETVGGHIQRPEPISLAFWYFVGLSALVLISAVVWAIWGMGAASVLLLFLSLGLIASWIIL